MHKKQDRYYKLLASGFIYAEDMHEKYWYVSIC